MFQTKYNLKKLLVIHLNFIRMNNGNNRNMKLFIVDIITIINKINDIIIVYNHY